MTDLSPEARRLLGLARRGDEPLQTDRARLNRRMSRHLALAAGVTGLTLGTTKLASGAAVTTLVAKALATGVVVTATVFGLWKAAERVHARHDSTLPRASAHSEARPPNVPATPQFMPTLRAPSDEAPPETQTPVATQLREGSVPAPPQPKQGRLEAERRVISKSQAVNSTNVEGLEPPRQEPLQEEVTAFRSVQQAIAAGQADRVLGLVAEQNQRFAGGALQQERAAARVVALCSLGRSSDARREAQAFERSWPRSPLIARVRRACDHGAMR